MGFAMHLHKLPVVIISDVFLHHLMLAEHSSELAAYWFEMKTLCLWKCAVSLVAEATTHSSLEGGNIALVVFILVFVLSVLLGGAYVYVSR